MTPDRPPSRRKPVVSSSPEPVSASLQRGIWIAVILAVGYGLYQVIALRWVCDDAFISFRYARNLVDGLGLVYNAGERVEGYTNFLWTVIMAAGMWLKLAPESLSIWLGALAFIFSVGLFGHVSFRLFRNHDRRPVLFLPLTSVALLLHHESHVYATSGLETSLVTALVSLGFAILVFAERNRTYLFAGIVVTAAVLTRPDSMIFFVMAAGFILLIKRPPFRPLLYYLAPFALIFVPYWIIRYNYYGFPFPNTYYAKSAGLPYYSQGLVYLWLYFKSYYVMLLAPVIVVWLAMLRGRSLLGRPIADPVNRAFLLTVLLVVPYLCYVLRSGGDFMFGRFLIPVTPLLFFLIEIGVRSAFTRASNLVPIAAIVLACVVLRWNPYADDRVVGYVANEPAYYTESWVERAKTVGERLKQYFAGTHATISYRGMFAMYAYYSQVPVAIEQSTGLTDTFIAHQPITARGRPGHEKTASHEYLGRRGVNFVFQGGVVPSGPADSLALIHFGDFTIFIYTYDVPLMEHLKQFPEITFRDIRLYLDSLRTLMPDKAPPQVMIAYPFFKAYYFDHNVDPARQKWFLDAQGL